MRLSDWRSVAPHANAISDKVIATIEPVLMGLGAEQDPPARYTILAIADSGLVLCSVRVLVPQEGPRAAGKLIRWSRVQVGELGVERQAGHTVVNFQVEGQLLRGVDDEVGRVTEFALDVFAGLDGRPFPSRAVSPKASGARSRRSAP